MMNTNISIKFRNREVRNPVLRVIWGFVLAILALLMGLFWLVGMFLLVILSPVIFLLHLTLRASGRKGFVSRSRGELNINVGIDGFRKA